MSTSNKQRRYENDDRRERARKQERWSKSGKTRKEIKETDDEDERSEVNGRRGIPVLVSSRRTCWLFGLLVGSVLNVDEHQLNSLNSSPTVSPSTISFYPHNTDNDTSTTTNPSTPIT